MFSLGQGRSSRLVLLVLGILLATGVAAQLPASRDHRLRFRPVRWRVFRAPAFHLYYPEGADSLAAFAAREWPEALARLKATGSNLPAPKDPQIVLYPAATAHYASNIGKGLPGTLALPTFVRTGNRLLVPYDGSYDALRAQLRTALVRAAWDAAFPAFGLGQQATGTGASLPVWYREGTIAWMASGWRPENEDAWRSVLAQHPDTFWAVLADVAPVLAGGAFNYYLEQTVFPRAPQGVLAMVRSKGTLARGQRLVTKSPLDTVLARSLRWYRVRFGLDTSGAQGTDSVGTRLWAFRMPAGSVRSWCVAPDGQAVALVADRPSRREVWRFDREAKQGRNRLVAHRLPPWLAVAGSDPYPLLAWEGNALWVLTPYKKGFRLARWDGAGRKPSETDRLPGIDGVRQFASLGGGRFLLAAHRQGQSDLVVWDSRRLRFTPWTMDAPDDGTFALPAGVGTDREAIFSSARRQAADSGKQLWHGLYRLRGTAVTPVVADTAAWLGWGAPQPLDRNRILTASTRTGTARWTVVHETGQSEPLRTGALLQVLPGLDRVAVLQPAAGDSLELRTEPAPAWLERHRAGEGDTSSPWLADYRRGEAQRRWEDSVLRAARDTTPSFLAGVLGAAGKSAARSRDSLREASEFRPAKATRYVLQLHTAYFTTRINNDYFINRYQPYRAYLGSFKFPEVGALAQAGFSDVFEDHRFTVAYRLPTATQGSDFFIRYNNDKRRTGWGLAYFRKVESLRPDGGRGWKADDGRPYPAAAKVKTHYAELTLERPLAYDAVLNGTLAVRKDRTVFLATDRYGLDFEALTSLWSIATASGAIDRRILGANDLYRGWSARLTLDGFKGFGSEETALGAARVQAEGHLPLGQAIGLVARAQAGTSGGGARVRYTLGGVDGAVNPRVDDSTARAPQAVPYAFQTLATPLRGYAQNSLWGDRYALGNVDLYVAVLPLLDRATALDALNRLQLGLWADGAMARESGATGIGARQLWAFGWSARTTLAGYPLRLDWGWPGTFGEPPVYYLSLQVR